MKKMKTYSIEFIDAKDGCYNHKLLQAYRMEDACAYMRAQGHEIIKIEVRQ